VAHENRRHLTFRICRLRGGNLHISTWCIKHAMLKHVMFERAVRCCRLNTAYVIVLQLCTTCRLLCKLYLFRRSRDRVQIKSYNILIDLTIPVELWAWDQLKSLKEMSSRNPSGDKGRPARRSDNLTNICEPII
jgi:hypothetical protein